MEKRCQRLVLTCMDYRFEKIYNHHIETLGGSDRIAFAGASKSIVDEDTRATALKQIKLAYELHEIEEVYILDHEDCGGYGGKEAVSSNEEEMEIHRKTALKAKEIIDELGLGLRVTIKMAMLDGSIIDLG